METMINTQEQQRRASVDEKNSQYHYTFTPNQLENLNKNV
jgi:hypothetical protein